MPRRPCASGVPDTHGISCRVSPNEDEPMYPRSAPRPPSSGLRRWLASFATVLLLPAGSTILVLALFEVGLRVAGHRPIYEIYSKPTLFWQHDALLGWSHQPNVDGVYVGPRPWPIEFEGRVAINSLGLRGPEVPPVRPGEPRILVMGDSMVASFEVDHEETFVALLEIDLRERLGIPVQVINGGVRGYGTDQSLLVFREHADALAPDLVIFFHSRNDRVDNTTLHEMRRPLGKPAFALTPQGSLELRGTPVPVYPMCSEVRLSPEFAVVRTDTLFARLMCRAQIALLDHSALFSLITVSIRWDGGLLGWLYRLGGSQTGALAPPDAGPPDYATRLTQRLLVALADDVQKRGAELVVIGFPTHFEGLDLEPLIARGVEIVELDALERAPAREVRWRHDSHLNPEGHRRLAATLANQLETRLRNRLDPRRASRVSHQR